MPTQRPFLSTFFAAFRQQPASALPAAATASQQTNKHSTQTSSSTYSTSTASAQSTPQHGSTTAAVRSQLPLHSPGRSHNGGSSIPIPNAQDGAAGRRRGSNSSSEGFREVFGAEKWYIGGKTAAGEEKFFKLGVVRRVRSGDRLSLDRLSL